MLQNDKPQGANAYELLRDEILRGELMPGERLRAAELSTRFKIGLTPLREALMRLASEGLVESENHRGARVRDSSIVEFRDMMQTRREIERLCLTKSMALGDTAWEGDILRAFHVLARTPLPTSALDRDAAAAWEKAHRQFHLALVQACGSDWLLHFWNILADHTERYRKLRLLRRQSPEASVRDVNAEHEEIMEAVIARDPAALPLMDEHLLRTEEAVIRLMEETEFDKGRMAR